MIWIAKRFFQNNIFIYCDFINYYIYLLLLFMYATFQFSRMTYNNLLSTETFVYNKY